MCAAFKKKRFYLFSSRNPTDGTAEGGAESRDVFNEKPTREEQASVRRLLELVLVLERRNRQV